MSAGNRFSYMKGQRKNAPDDVAETSATADQDAQTPGQDVSTPPVAPAPEANLRRVARGEGRYPGGMTANERRATTAQLNVRLTPMLKRRAAAQAALEGVSVGDLVERLLIAYLESTKSKQ